VPTPPRAAAPVLAALPTGATPRAVELLADAPKTSPPLPI
jgi:hypothetical protein